MFKLNTFLLFYLNSDRKCPQRQYAHTLSCQLYTQRKLLLNQKKFIQLQLICKPVSTQSQANPIIYLAGNLILKTRHSHDRDLSDDPWPMAAIDGQLVPGLYSIQGEGKTIRVAVRPKVVVVEVERVSGESQAFSIAQTNRLQHASLSVKQVTVCPNVTDAVPESWDDPGVHIDSCERHRMSTLSPQKYRNNETKIYTEQLSPSHSLNFSFLRSWQTFETVYYQISVWEGN